MDTKIDIESEKQTTLPTVSFKSDKFKRYINFWQYIKFQIVYFANHQSRNSKEMQYSHQNMAKYQFSKLIQGVPTQQGFTQYGPQFSTVFKQYVLNSMDSPVQYGFSHILLGYLNFFNISQLVYWQNSENVQPKITKCIHL